MRRTWMISATAGIIAIATVVAALTLWFRQTELAASASPSLSASASAEAGLPQIPWAFFSQLPPDGGPGKMVVQAGVLGEGRRRVDVEVPWVVDHDIDLARTPAVARPAGGAVVFAADDGDTSTIYRLPVEPGADPEAVAVIDDTVWSIAALPDGSAAYLALVTRGRPDVDLGVVRVALDGSGTVEPFLPPVAVQPEAGVRFVAIAPFTVTLDISGDGRYLARSACRGPAGCTTSLIELSSGDIRELPEVTFVDLGTDGLIVANQCDGVGCTAKLIEVESGTSVDLPGSAGDITVVSADDGPVVVAVEADGVHTSVVLTDPRTGDRRDLYRAPDGSWMALGTRTYFVPATDGAVLLSEFTDRGGQVRERLVLVPLDGGAPVELPVPPIREIVPPGVQG